MSVFAASNYVERHLARCFRHLWPGKPASAGVWYSGRSVGAVQAGTQWLLDGTADFARSLVVAGGSPAATHFLCFAKESKQRKATPRSSALRASLRYSKRQAAAELGLEWAELQKVEDWLALRQSSRTPPVVPVLLGDSHGDPTCIFTAIARNADTLPDKQIGSWNPASRRTTDVLFSPTGYPGSP